METQMNKKQILHLAISLIFGLLLAFASIFLLSSFAWNARAASALSSAPTVTNITPPSASNDMSVRITVTGAGFVAPPVVGLGNITLNDVGWVSSTVLTATVPWGLPPDVYTLTVSNPNGESSSLPNAFTVTQGINVWTTDGPYGGLINYVVVNPATPTTLFAYADGIGVFRSRNSGEHWQKVIESPNSGEIVFNASGDTVYVGGADGLFRSTDGGDSWERIPNFTLAFTHPVSDSVVYAITEDWLGSTLSKSEDGGLNWVNWSKGITDTIRGQNGIGKLVFDPVNPQMMYLGTESGNIFRSVDGGTNWTFASRPVNALWEMAINPFGAHEVWVGPDNRWGDTSSVLVKSANPELTAWTPLGQQWTRYIRFAPLSWGEAYSGTVYLPFINFLKSMDGGATWAKTDFTFLPQDLAFSPTDPNRLYTGGNGGVQLSLNGGQSWSPVNDGLAALIPNRLAVAPHRPETVYTLVAHAGLYGSEQAGASWKSIRVTGESASSESALSSFLVDPYDNSRLYTGGNDKIYISDDEGLSWTASGVLPVPGQYSDCSIDQHVLRADPATPGRLLAGVGYFCDDWSSMNGGLYLSTDSGLSWSYPDVTSVISQVNDILYDPGDPAKVYAAAKGILISTDSGSTWQSTSDLLTDKNIYSLAAESGTPYRIYAATQYDEQHVYRSDDGGATWMEVTSPPSNISQQGLVVMPGWPQVLYAATWAGLYRSDDGAQSWQRVDGQLGWVPIFSLAAATEGQRAILYVGTGGGIANFSATQRTFAASEDTLVNAGVYRFTQLISRYVYLPFVGK